MCIYTLRILTYDVYEPPRPETLKSKGQLSLGCSVLDRGMHTPELETPHGLTS